MLLLVLAARAAVPLPTYPECGEPDRPELCPWDLYEAWNFLSYVPAGWRENVRADERELGAGMWVDRAWRITTGRPDVVIAVLDSGVEWDEPDLLRKHWLNVAELPMPEGADSYDANGDGLVNIDDWAGDSRVAIDAGVDVADGLLDPSDLIHAFSDGVDDDGNGYVDDIAGWDFHWNDNDPYDDTRFGHGTGMARYAAAEGEDGVGRIGTCPNCMVLHVRVGDAFVTDGSPFGTGLAYAVDLGADVVLDAIGALSHSDAVRAAIDYAWDNDVLVIGSAGDETSWHPNPPGSERRTFYVHGMRYDGDSPETSSSFLAYENCTNHGARLDGSAASTDCSSGATGVTTGIAGLVLSAAREQGITLTAGELHALLSNTADDVWLPVSDAYYPSQEGWDAFFGNGRVNAARAVERVVSGDVPPAVDLLEPDWFAWIRPDEPFRVEGRVTARAGLASWRVEVGEGLEPTAWRDVGEGTGEEVAFDLSLAAVGGPLADYAYGTDTVAREYAVNTSTVTLRVVATDVDGRTTVARRAVYVHDDPDLLAGFPLRLGGSIEGSPTLCDLDGDGAFEVIQPDGAGRVHVLDGRGQPLPGWPVTTEPLAELDPENPDNHRAAAAYGALDPDVYAPVIGAVAVGDVDGDGAPELVGASLRGRLWAWGADGAVKPGFPVAIHPVGATDPDNVQAAGFLATPALGDLDGDGVNEIVIGAMDGQVYAWTGDGAEVPGFPVRPQYPGYEAYTTRIVSSPALGDLDGDGDDEIVIGTNETLDGEHSALYALDGDGTMVPGWPAYLYGLYVDVLPVVGEGFPGAAALVDLDGDGALEVVAHALAGDLTVLDGAGEELDTYPTSKSAYGEGSNVSDNSLFPLMNSPSVGDLSGDGVPDVVTGAAGIGYARSTEYGGQRIPFDHAVAAWSGADGTFLPGWPRVIEDLQFFQNPAVADIDGDGAMEALTGSGGFLLHAWDGQGRAPSGWPKLTGHWIVASPAVGDIDGDGLLEVVVGTRDGKLFAWRTASPAGADVAWAMFGRDPAHTRNAEKPLDGYNAGYPRDPVADEPGCGCASTGGVAWGWAVGLAAAAAARRRRTLVRLPPNQ